jgi:hypothetical protein
MFADLELSQTANFYRAVGRVGRIFMELESEALRCPSDARGIDGKEIAMSKPSDSRHRRKPSPASIAAACS